MQFGFIFIKLYRFTYKYQNLSGIFDIKFKYDYWPIK